MEGTKAKSVRISEIQAVPQALNSGDVFVYDTGKEIWQVRLCAKSKCFFFRDILFMSIYLFIVLHMHHHFVVLIVIPLVDIYIFYVAYYTMHITQFVDCLIVMLLVSLLCCIYAHHPLTCFFVNAFAVQRQRGERVREEHRLVVCKQAQGRTHRRRENSRGGAGRP